MAPTREELRSYAAAVARRRGVPPEIFLALVSVESAWDPSAESWAGAAGLTQLMPATAAELGIDDRLNPWASLDGGAEYLRRKLEELGDDVAAALAAYNAGAGRVRAAGWPARGWLAAMPAETRRYVPKVLTLAGWTLVAERAWPPNGGPATEGPGPGNGLVAVGLVGLAGALALLLAGGPRS